MTRRQLLRSAGNGFGVLGLATLLASTLAALATHVAGAALLAEVALALAALLTGLVAREWLLRATHVALTLVFLFLHLAALGLQGRHLFLREDAFSRLHECLHALLRATVLVTLLDERIHLRLLVRREIEFRVGLRAIHLRIVRTGRAATAVLVLVAGESGSYRERYCCHQS